MVINRLIGFYFTYSNTIICIFKTLLYLYRYHVHNKLGLKNIRSENLRLKYSLHSISLPYNNNIFVLLFLILIILLNCFYITCDSLKLFEKPPHVCK